MQTTEHTASARDALILKSAAATGVSQRVSDGVIEFVVSHESPDLVGDVIVQRGIAPVSDRLPAQVDHSGRMADVIGYWSALRNRGDYTTAELHLVDPGISKMADLVRGLANAGVRLAASIGFTASESEPLKPKGWRFKTTRLHEISVVVVPCQPLALQVAKSLGLSLPEVPATAIQHADVSVIGASAQTIPKPDHPKGSTMNLSDRIVAAQKRQTQLADRAVAITVEMESDTADQDALADELKSVNADLEKQISLVATLKQTETNIAHRAEPITAPAVAPNLMKRKDPRTPSDLFVKMAIGTLVAKRDGIPFDVAIEQTYKDGDYVKDCAALIRKTATGEPPLNTFTPSAAQELVMEATNSWVEAVTVQSAAAALGARARMINFNGRQSARVTRRNPTALTGLTEPAWVHESRPIPIMGFGVGQQTVERGKLAAIIPFTMELLESNLVADLESELRLAMVEAAAVRLDTTFFSAVAGVTRVHPAGILNGVTIGAGTAGGGVDAVSADIRAMYNEMVAARVGARPVLILNTQDRMSVNFMRTQLGDLAFRDELAAGTLMGIPVISSQVLPAKTAVMVDAAYLGWGMDAPMFKYSEEASLVAANADGTQPTMAGTAGAAPTGGTGPAGTLQAAGQVALGAGIQIAPNTGAGAAPAYSLYQTFSAALRLVQHVGWAALATGAVAARNTLTW
jgi:hypothetical protein